MRLYILELKQGSYLFNIHVNKWGAKTVIKTNYIHSALRFNCKNDISDLCKAYNINNYKIKEYKKEYDSTKIKHQEIREYYQ